MMPRILAPLAGILLLASYACAGTTTLATTVPAPNGSYIDIVTGTLTLRPQATAPTCTDGKLYFDDITKEVKICNGGFPESPGPWERDDEIDTTYLQEIDDSVIVRGSQNLANITLQGSVAGIGGAINTPVSIPAGVGVTAFYFDPTKGGAFAAGIQGASGGFANLGTSSVRFGDNNSVIGPNASILGGTGNSIDVASALSVITAGYQNRITNSRHNFIGGGRDNTASGPESSIVGGTGNTNQGAQSFIGGGTGNLISGNTNNVISGGQGNTVSGDNAAIGGGTGNLAEGPRSFVGGGASNQATGEYSAIAGGNGNLVSGNNSFASGSSNQVIGANSGAYGYYNIVDADWSNAFGRNLAIYNPDTNAFSGGVAIGHNSVRPGARLDVNGEAIVGAGTTARYVAGGSVPLYTVGAIVDADANILANYGVTRVDPADPKGTYRITFPTFLTLPIVHATAISDKTQISVIITEITTSTATIAIFDASSGDYTEEDFTFSAIGTVSAPGAI